MPAHGLLACLSITAAVGGIFLAYRHSPAAAFVVGMLVFISAPAVFYGAVKIYPKSPVGKRVLLQQPKADPGFDHEAAELERLVGQRGFALTLLRPAGSVDIGGKIVDALSESEQIEAGHEVEVIRVAGMKVFVKSA